MGRRRVLEVHDTSHKAVDRGLSFPMSPFMCAGWAPPAIELASFTRATTDPADRMRTCISSRPPDFFLTLNRFVYVDEQ